MAAVVSSSVVCACGASKKEVAEARASVYDADFAIVYSAAVAAVRELYPDYRDDPAAGRVSTSWHTVKYSDPGADDPKSTQIADQAQGIQPDPSQSGGSTTSAGSYGVDPNYVHQLNFIRFDVLVTGGRPWRVKVKGAASRLEPGNALPTELHGADEPHWLAGRTDELIVAIHRRLKRYAIKAPVEVEAVKVDAPPPATVKGDIPDGARTTAIAVVTAIRVRDSDALRDQLADDVQWSLGAPPGIDGAMAMWQADPSALGAIAKAIEAGCGKDGDEVQCPAMPAPNTWRVRLGQRHGGWRLTAFIAAP
ncbi:MAG TPA: hypothetical protein VHE35_29655 [Kofleriaceae bacterium]|nr:hypothetical protein [Kofleriaceae bacterium]